MAWKKQSTSISIDVDAYLDEFREEQLLQGLIDAKWISEQEAEAIRLRKATDDKRSVFQSSDADELDEARDNLRRGRKTEALIHLERFLGREWSGLLQ